MILFNDQTIAKLFLFIIMMNEKKIIETAKKNIFMLHFFFLQISPAYMF